MSPFRDETWVKNKKNVVKYPVNNNRKRNNLLPTPNTYTQIHIQAIFGVKKRIALIQPTWENHLYKYITGIVQTNKHKLLAINGVPDHVHVFFGVRPHQSLSDLMQDI